MAFVSTSPVTIAIGVSTFTPTASPQICTNSLTSTKKISSSPIFYPPKALFESIRDRFRQDEPTRSPTSDFRTMAIPSTQIPLFDAVVVSINPVSRAKDHIQLTIDVSSTDIISNYTTPGQCVMLSRPTRTGKPISCIATIASPPSDNGSMLLDFLILTTADPCGLASSKPGERIAISHVMGNGLDIPSFPVSKGDLHIFTDAPQGFAAAKALIEWSHFRSATGEGANRNTHVTIYYSVPSPKSIPYTDRYSQWSVYGVNIVPLPGVSLLEHMSSNRPPLSRGSLSHDFALACVTSMETYESLFCELVLCGLKRASIYRFTSDVIEYDVENTIFDNVSKNNDNMFENPFPQDPEKKREQLEREIWENWVRVREAMKQEFELRWAAQSRIQRDAERAQKEKEQAWASWAAQNSGQWKEVKWDDVSWGNYWSTWRASRNKWSNAGGGGGDSSSSTSWNNKETWNQQNSQEYWDWVGRGAGSKKRTTPSGGHGYGGGYGAGARTSGTTGAWDTNSKWSGYQRGGYKYEHQEPAGSNKNSYANGTGSSYNGTGTGWSGWNRNNTRQNSRTGSGQKRWGGWANNGAKKEELDFYGVLGITAGASKAEIKKAYRRKAMEHHPDRNLDKTKEANVKMKQVVVAWTVLKDDNKRRKYDQYGHNGL